MTVAEGTLPPLLLVGGGKMGGALLAGWRELGLPDSVVVDPSPLAAGLAGPGVLVVKSMEAVPAGFEPGCIVLAVKPQQADAVLGHVEADGALVLSIMAGRSLAGLEAALGGDGRAAACVVRAMPNTPAAIRQGVTVACAGGGVSAEQRALADRLLRAVGAVAWVEEEGMIDAVTAISGGGPAYVFLLAELLERAGLEQGLPPALARTLARVTVSGSGALLAAGDVDAAALRVAVTSPKGTTEQALAVLMAPEAWPAAVSAAVEAATRRSRALAG